jgi:excisionase family DNA binding protein
MMQLNLEPKDIGLLADALMERLRPLIPELPKSPSLEPAYLDVGDICVLMNCKRQRVYDLACKGLIPHYKDGKKLKFDKLEIESWYKSRLQRVPASNA